VVKDSRDSTDSETDTPPVATSGKLPAWCNVYEGLTDWQVADLEKIVLTRADLTRSTTE
jgi:hypothetical protein